MKYFRKFLCLFLSAVFLLLTACGPDIQEISGSDSSGEDEADMYKSDIPDAWWANFARFSNPKSINDLVDLAADAVTTMGGVHDEGIGALARENFFIKEGASRVEGAHALGIKAMAWLELMGEARTHIGAVNEMSPGVFEQDSQTGLTKMVASYYDWNANGFGINPNANKIVWFGAHSWANREPFYGSLAMPTDFMEPRYPNGESALGLLKDGSVDPRDYKFYDALACKSIFGTFVEQEQFATPDYRNLEGFLEDTLLNGQSRKIGDYYFSRDIAADWWIEYNRDAVRSFLKQGVDGFWVDNYTGWGFLSAFPVTRAFGEWSVAGFTGYLEKHPIEGIDPQNFDVRQYMIRKTKENFPELDTSVMTNATVQMFSSPAWLEDPVWNSYLAYKSETVSEHIKKFYQMVKEEAKNLGLNPDDIVVTGNDIALMQNGVLGIEDYVDVLSVEYGPTYSAVTQQFSDKLPLLGYGGPVYKLITQLSRSKRGSVWYYVDDAEKADQEMLGMFLSFEALANNITINSGDGNPTTAGNDETTAMVNAVIGQLRDVYKKREIKASVGLYNSGTSELSQLTPGGYVGGGDVQSTLAYYGWGSSLENQNIAYQTVTENRISAKELENIEVLVMPNVITISQDIVNGILKPFLDQGKTLVITGAKAGEKGMRDQQFAKHDKPLLVNLKDTYSGKGKIVYLEKDPTVDAYKQKTNTTLFKMANDKIGGIFADLEKEGRYHPDVKTSGFKGDILLTTQGDRENKTCFVDLVNRNIDVDQGVVNAKQTGKIAYKLPSWKTKTALDVKIYCVDEDGKLHLTEKTLQAKDGYLAIEVPEFTYYASLVIS